RKKGENVNKNRLRQGERGSALWGSGTRGGDSRGSALWGKGGRRAGATLMSAALAAVVLSFGASLPANADSGSGKVASGTFIPGALLSQAQADPDASFKVIVQGDGTSDADHLANKIGAWAAHADQKLADAAAKAADNLAKAQVSGNIRWTSSQLWPYESGVSNNWEYDQNSTVAMNMPTIAIVDSGVQDRADFGSRLLTSVNLSTLPTNTSGGDGRGHGTFVAGVAAGSSASYAGASPSSNLVSIDVLDDEGMGLTSDIINACQWILDHQAQYNIKVANFSLHSSITAPFYIDPLDRAVEKLWFKGITVV